MGSVHSSAEDETCGDMEYLSLPSGGIRRRELCAEEYILAGLGYLEEDGGDLEVDEEELGI